MHHLTRTRIKMCGMTRKMDIKHAIHLGVDAIGIIFYQHSPRHVTIEQAKRLLEDVPAFVDIVAVVVNPQEAWLKQIVNELPIQFIQFHGEEPATFCEQFGLSYIKAVAVTSSESIEQATITYQHAAGILLDTPATDRRGGVGVPFDWGLIPQGIDKPLILAGGINSLNVHDAIAACAPYAIDVNSGVEASPGIKDHQKMNQFIKAVWGKNEFTSAS